MVNAWLSVLQPAARDSAATGSRPRPAGRGPAATPAALQILENRTLMSGDGLAPQFDSYRDDEYATVFPGAVAPNSDAVAPFYTVFDATETFLDNGNGSTQDRADLVNAVYRWSIDGDAAAQRDGGGRLVRDIIGDTTESEGLVVGHVFDRAGVYTVTLDVSLTDANGVVRQATTSQTIQIDHEVPRGFTADSFRNERLWERDVQGAEYRLIGGSAADAQRLADQAPEGVTIRHYASNDFAQAFEPGATGLDKVRIYFNRGETYTFNSRNGLIDLPDADDLYIGAYGSAAAPPLLDVADNYNTGGSQAVIRVLNGSDGVTIEGLDIEGRGDNNNLSIAQGGDGLAADLRRLGSEEGQLSGIVSHDARSVLLRDLDISQVSQHGVLTSGEGTDGLGLFDSRLHDLSRYGAYLGADNAQALARNSSFGNFTVSGNHIYNISGGEHGIRVQGLTPDSPDTAKPFLDNVYIVDNVIETNPDAPSKTAIQVRGNTQNIVIADNTADRVIGLQPQNRANGAYEEIRQAQVFDNYVGLSRESFPGTGALYGHGYFAFQIYADDVSVRGNIADDYNVAFDISGARLGSTTIDGRARSNVFITDNVLINRDRAGLRDAEPTFRDSRLVVYQHLNNVTLTNNQSFNVGFSGRGIEHVEAIAAQNDSGNAPQKSGNILGQTLTGLASDANPTHSITDAASALRERLFGVDTPDSNTTATPEFTPAPALPAGPVNTPAPAQPAAPVAFNGLDAYENNNSPNNAFSLGNARSGSLSDLGGTALTDTNRVGDYYRLTHAGGDLSLNLEADSEVTLQLFSGTGNAIHLNGAIATQNGNTAEQDWSNLPAGEYTLLIYDRGTGELPYDLTWNAGVDVLDDTDTPVAPAAPSIPSFNVPAPANPTTTTGRGDANVDPYESNDNPGTASLLNGAEGSLSTASGLATVDANRRGDYYAIEINDGSLALELTTHGADAQQIGVQLYEGVRADLHNSEPLQPDRIDANNLQHWDNLDGGDYTVLVWGTHADEGIYYDLDWSQA